ncbi:DUF305 domain-containing protein [Pseudokineococcus marinus]|uniref:DUF305 domain-containing protein n=1 Tax=Pseudokineococcus marinus TaxID=351215 RepID=A0A849BP75_9ACTN|nr:DUF305 domain-containing protein [Pseudokineococcus marinus]NNH22837.1 DUF305 domain-containing protein [Pseudokineococcus marinus]
MTTHRTTSTRPTARRAAGALALAAALVLAGCGDDVEAGGPAPVASSAPSASAGSSASASAADVAFLTGMIPHHRQATEMAQLVDGRSEDPEVTALAQQIEGEQQPEIDEMSALLESYGEPVPEGMPGEGMSMDGMDHEGMDHEGMEHEDMDHEGTDHGGASGMEGMMSPEDMASLEAASGAEFDRMWLTMMVEHHRGAVSMSETALEDAQDPQVRELAQRIITAQEAEISTMEGLLAQG